VRSNWENDACTKLYIEEERYGGKWEVGDCRGVRGNTEQGLAPYVGERKAEAAH
jgi:hypothetical protein